MELIEGETLADRIAKGALPLDQALVFPAQIAAALDPAHRAEGHIATNAQNIMLARDGVKVLDFGLAKSAAANPGPVQPFTSAWLERLVRRCLKKDPKERFSRCATWCLN